MKILKSNTNQVFDTENIDSIESYSGEKMIDISKSLHQNIETTVCQFLAGYFPVAHTIFDNFKNSYYWLL